ncbi:MAG TPA: class I SAM-dependent methyltransferase [Baekduia sp.]|uniref:class I SAM-dependent methyltransferase n=1 Tax=Baekduia sp. TaxID=2600305 RepID=UPI002D76905A|nr:class I SAM-dependent methyltransferase [Baekduia sp.]HET6508219.1 class I SAM-dependent methyltransferase [Baekduia sp.]
MAFARDADTHAYYEARAAEYDEWYEGTGRFATRDRPGWADEVERLVGLDVACGTAFLTRHLRGDLVVGLDRSPAMVAIAQHRLRERGGGDGDGDGGLALTGDALALPFADGAFDRVLTGHFYGHLVPAERAAFLAEARRVAPGELVVIDSAPREHGERERWEERILNDGSRHRVFKRFLSGADLAAELGGGGEAEILMDGRWFSAVRA